MTIHPDAAGDDRRNLNGEYMLVRNTGAAAINLAGWKLDAGDRSHIDPDNVVVSRYRY